MFTVVVAWSSLAVGTTFIPAFTLIVTVALSESPSASVTAYRNVAVPTKSAAGVNVTVLSALATAEPLVAAEVMDTEMGVSSRPVSLDSTSTVTGVLNEQPRRSSLATGMLLGFSITVMVTVAVE